VVGFQHRTEAERFLKEFRERLAKFGLELHPDKTRLIEFGRFAARDRKQWGEGKPETFTFLGFTHYCGQRHKSGTFTVWRITAKKRMVAKLKAIKAELQRRMHDRMAEVGAWLRKVVLGYYSAGKAGISSFTQWLAVHMAQEYSPRIRVNAIAPGFFLTNQNRFLVTDRETGEYTPRGKAIVAHTPMGRFGEPEELLGGALWLLSPASSFVTGAVVFIDGGFTAFGGV
jgi:NAD(P)-dependent dehydrogenase (short-subunit alcohol dehydrogenase family)